MLRSCTTVARHRCRSVLVRQLSNASASSHCEDYDVVIVGGGPAGLALASALGSNPGIRDNLRISLIEAGDLSKVREWSPAPGAFSNRVSSLTNASQAFLQDIGAWEYVELERTCAVEAMEVWDGVSDARIQFSTSELSTGGDMQGMARLTENLNLQRGLLRHLNGLDAVHITDKTKVTSIVRQKDEDGAWPIIHLDNSTSIRARLLIGADGPNSPVRNYAGIQSFGWSYDTQGIVATLNHAPRGAFQPPNNTAYQRFLPTGPIAFLPLSPTSSSLVWSTKPALASAILASDSSVLAYMVNAAFRLPSVSMRYLHSRILEGAQLGQRLTADQIANEIAFREQSHSIDHTSAYASSHVRENAPENLGIPPEGSDMLPPLVTGVQAGTPASFPLRFNHTESYIGEGDGARTVLVGDAAHTVHPLAGQGLNLGLADVECLASVINSAVSNGADIGTRTALLPYTQERYFENHKLMSVFDKLHKIYSTDREPVVALRSVGVEVLNEFDTLKTAMMMTAGSRASRQRPNARATIFGLASSAFEAASSASKVVDVAKGALGSVAVQGFQHLAQLSNKFRNQ